MESEQNCVTVPLCMKLEGDTIALYARVWPTMQVNGKVGLTVFGAFLARNQETYKEVVEVHKYKHNLVSKDTTQPCLGSSPPFSHATFQSKVFTTKFGGVTID